jgi:predicted choloylglycine hydrolase
MTDITDTRRTGGQGPGGQTGGAWPPPSADSRRFSFSRSTLEVDHGIWHLRVRESGYRETGLAIGSLLAASGYPAVRVFGGRRARFVIKLLYGATKRDFKRIRIPERYLEELQGYAEGAGLPFKTLFFMNFVFDILKKYGFHCSSVAFAGTGRTLIGRNTDLIPWIAKAALKWFPPVVLDVGLPGKLRYVHVTPGLFLGVLSGFNERGMALMSHQIAATREDSVPGNLATPLLQRMILEEATDLSGAESLIRANPIQRCISNLVTSDAEGASRVFEITPKAVKATGGANRFLSCATHFKDAEFSRLHRRKTPISEARLRLLDLLAARTKPVPDEVIAILRNHDNGLVHRKSGHSPANEGTYQSIVFDVTGRRVFVSDGARLPVSLTGTFREIVLGED